MVKHRHKHVKKIIKYFSDFAVHIWIILLLANVLLVYTFHFYLHAASEPKKVTSSLENVSDIQSFSVEDEQTDAVDEPIATLTPEPTEVPPLVPNGPLLGLSFSVPGIGSGGGNLKPVHPTRNVTIYLYPTGVNAFDKKIRPLNTVKTKVYYDGNEFSPTYTMFINSKIDLGSKVADGDYQVLIKTDKSFRQLIKERPSNVGGIVYSLERRKDEDEFPILPPQTMIMGDLYPLDEADNIVDLNDYAVLVNCFQQRRGTPTCPNPRDADINDDGMVDGLDYNVMVLSYQRLQDQGITVPKLAVPPTGTNVSRLSYLTPKVTKSPAKPTPTLVPDEPKDAGGGAIGGVIVLVFLLGIVGGGGFFLYMKNPQVKAMIDGILHRSPKATPPPAQDATVQGQVPPAIPASPAPSESPTTSTSPTPPVESVAPAASSIPSPAAPPAAKPAEPASTGAVEAKEYFVKKQSEDETKTGFWLTLTDDNGPQLAHYKGTEVTDGFAQIKGEMKTENNKTFLEITELTPEA